jgi:hypothetical protein
MSVSRSAKLARRAPLPGSSIAHNIRASAAISLGRLAALQTAAAHSSCRSRCRPSVSPVPGVFVIRQFTPQGCGTEPNRILRSPASPGRKRRLRRSASSRRRHGRTDAREPDEISVGQRRLREAVAPHSMYECVEEPVSMSVATTRPPGLTCRPATDRSAATADLETSPAVPIRNARMSNRSGVEEVASAPRRAGACRAALSTGNHRPRAAASNLGLHASPPG